MSTIIDRIMERRDEFIAVAGVQPVRIHMTIKELSELKREIQRTLLYNAMRDFSDGIYFYGMKVIETDEPGFHMSS